MSAPGGAYAAGTIQLLVRKHEIADTGGGGSVQTLLSNSSASESQRRRGTRPQRRGVSERRVRSFLRASNLKKSKTFKP